jgi:hypothetical protein
MLSARHPSTWSVVAVLSLSSALFAAACAPPASPDSTGVSAPTNSPVTTSSPSGAPANPGPSCPPPLQSEMACAAVMVSVKVNGLCCTYGSPCAAPPGEQFSDEKCTHSNTIPPKKAASANVPPSSPSGGAPGTKPLPTRGQSCDLDTTPCAPGLKCFVEPMLPTRRGECR